MSRLRGRNDHRFLQNANTDNQSFLAILYPERFIVKSQRIMSTSSVSFLAPASIAPDFTLPSTIDNSISLSDLKGKPIILVFYPGDFTPVCGAGSALSLSPL
jgi:hypothetical protein